VSGGEGVITLAMKKLSIITTAAAVCSAFTIMGVSTSAFSATITSFDITDSGGGYGIFTSRNFSFIEAVMSPNEASLDWTVTSGDAGTTIYYNAGNNVNYASVVALLTNGSDDFIGYGGGSFESDQFSEVAGGNRIDLGGFDVTAIGLRVNSLTFNSPGQNPNGDGQWTDYAGSYTLLFEGSASIPEPTSSLLSVLGATMLLRRRRK
jgi:hypothetical protein